MDLQSALKTAGLSRVYLAPGYVCNIRDQIIKMPDNEATRDVHWYRRVLVLSSDLICATPECALITVAPLSSQLQYKKPNEIVLAKTKTNGLTENSRVMLGHLQPILKGDIEKKLGELSLDEWDDVMIQVVKNFDRA